jgi:hypothetical protein
MALFEPGHQELPTNDRQLKRYYNLMGRYAPQLYSLEAAYSPLYAALNASNFETSLLGTEGGTSEIEYLQRHHGKFRKRHRTVTTPASRGYLDLYANEIAPLMRNQAALDAAHARESDIADVNDLGPQLREALRVSSPDRAALLDKLYAGAMSDLDLGAGLNASQSRNVEQGIRAAQAARGMGMGGRDAFDEALGSLDYGRGLEQERRGYAGGVLGALGSFYGDPYARILARDTGSAAQAQSFLGITAGQPRGRPGLFDSPNYQQFQNTYRFNAEATNQDKLVGQQQWAHMMDQIKDSVMSSFQMGMGGNNGTGG